MVSSNNVASTNTKNNNTDERQQNVKSNATTSGTQKFISSAPAHGQGIDAHPFARGSVIEVLYGPFPAKYSSTSSDGHKNSDGYENEVEKKDNHGDGEEDDEDDEEEIFLSDEEEDLESNPNDNTNNNVDENQEGTEQDKNERSQDAQSLDIRLADIIDRAPSNTPNHSLPSHKWKYYIHYREHNRRMDEWVTDPRRIISPPSVGNAKVRAIKKREKKKREIEELMALEERENKLHRKNSNLKIVDGIAVDGSLLENQNQSGDGALAGTSPGSRPVSQRASSRRASAAIASAVQGNQIVNNNTSGNNNALSPSKVGGATSDNNAGSTGPGNVSSISATDAGDRSGNAEEDVSMTRRRRKSSRASNQQNNSENNENDGNNRNNLPRSSSLVLLPEEEQMKDKIVTVAAQELDEHEGLDEASLREHEEVTKVKNVQEVQLGQYRMDTWYYSPIPKEMLRSGNSNMVDILYVCEFTLNFFPRKEELLRFQAKQLHKMKRHPPGNEIYRNGRLSMFEVDGLEERLYCQNLCYIAKLFLDHKTLYFDVDPFLFYVLCEIDERGFHPVGYYSKEKYSDVGYNLACILTFPCHQRKGYGRFLIDFSYELSKKEEKVGSPEKPMSDLGQQAYKPYWTSTIVDFLLNQSDETSMSIMEISKRTSIMAEDIIFTLNMLGLLKYINGVYFITAEEQLLEELAKKHPVKEPRVDPSKLHWTPYVTDVKRDKFSIHSKKRSIEEEEFRGDGGF